MPMTSREMISYLKKNGFEVISQNGSHVKMSNPLTGFFLQIFNRICIYPGYLDFQLRKHLLYD